MSSDRTKILFVSNTANFQKFNRPFMRWCHAQGWQVDYASAGEEPILDCDNAYKIDVARSPFSRQNIKALKQLKKILYENDYDIVHCHTPMGAALARLAGKNLRKKGLKIIYTAHGFHFYKGAPLLNWLIYYPVEKWLSGHTDILITINKEDFERAKKKFGKHTDVRFMNGVGVDLSRFSPKDAIEVNELRASYKYKEDDFIIAYAAEFIHRKNHQFLINNLPELKKRIPGLRVILPGKGLRIEEVKKLAADLGVADIVWFAGYRKDIDKLCAISDIYVATSRQEGLPINVVEALAAGLPIVASNIRGQADIVTPGRNGDLFELNDSDGFVNKVVSLYKDPELRRQISENNVIDAKRYSVDIAVKQMAEIYASCL